MAGKRRQETGRPGRQAGPRADGRKPHGAGKPPVRGPEKETGKRAEPARKPRAAAAAPAMWPPSRCCPTKGEMRRVAVPLGLTPESARPREGRLVRLSGPTMGVAWTLTARLPAEVSDAAARAAVQDACDRVVAQMSTWEPDSDLCRFNRAPAGGRAEARG